jgi:hypothetical protein
VAAFLKSLSRLFGGKADPQLYLAAFGKHPGWNDHIDDMGLDTQALIAVKRLLYVQGINQNIDAGAWENPDVVATAGGGGGSVGGEAGARLAGFRHEFLWYLPPAWTGHADPALVAGRMWSSVDGKGRAKYPMVLAAQTVSLPDSFALRMVLPTLAKVHDRCAATNDAALVRQTLDAARNALRSRLHESPPAEALTANQVVAVARHPDMHSGAEGGAGGGFHRILYAFHQTFAAYRPGAAANGGKRPEQIRVPLAGLCPADALAFWLRVSLSLLDEATSILLLAADPAVTGPATTPPSPPSAGWVDILVGEPTPANFFAIKAGAKSLPLTSDIPYSLTPNFITGVESFLNQAASSPPDSPPPPWPAL